MRVVVVGGGLSGLVAARDLAREGAAVHVIEARSRLGGRIWTLRDAAFSPYSVEAGGEFIDGGHKAIRALTRELGLTLVRVLRAGFGLALERNGGVVVHRKQTAVWRAFKKALAPLAATLEEVNRDWDSTAAQAIARRSLDEVLAARRASSDVRGMASALRGFFLADSSTLSALVGVELSMEDTSPAEVPLYRIEGGNDRLILALTPGRNVRFSGGEVVTAVRQDANGVLLTLEGKGGARDAVAADYVVVTVPAPVLLSWDFSPPLPEEQRRALAALDYGAATKAMLRFATPWWRRGEDRPRRGDRGPRAFATNLPIGAVWDAAEEQRGAAILTLLGGGSSSLALRELIERDGAHGIRRQLEWLGETEPIEAIEEIAWDRDRWARGGYAFFSASFDPAWRDALARAFGRVLFAGDHTSRMFQGYMEGAVDSGHRVAKELAGLERLRTLAGLAPRTPA